MPWDVTIEGMDDLQRDWIEACGVLSDGARRGVAQGVEEGAAQARASHPYRDRTGALTASTRGRVDVSTRGGAEGVIEATAPYASFVESGTEPHEIRARRARALHWVDADGDHFARRVQHPGARQMPFIGPAAQKAERVMVREIEIAIVAATRIVERD